MNKETQHSEGIRRELEKLRRRILKQVWAHMSGAAMKDALAKQELQSHSLERELIELRARLAEIPDPMGIIRLRHVFSSLLSVLSLISLRALVRTRNQIKQPPGLRLLRFVEYFCSPKTMDQVFEPLVSDWQTEYFDALASRRWFLARCISVRYICLAVMAMGLKKVLGVLGKVVGIFSSANK